MTVALIDYGAGNLRSAEKGLERVAREIGRNQTVLLTRDPDVVAKADRVVLPGDGAFPFCRKGVSAIDGMEEAIRVVSVAKILAFTPLPNPSDTTTMTESPT